MAVAASPCSHDTSRRPTKSVEVEWYDQQREGVVVAALV